MQRNWIGRSERARVKFALDDPGARRTAGSDARRSVRLSGARADRSRASDREQRPIEVFTMRIDTIYGANFLMLAPEHPLVQQWGSASPVGRTSVRPRSRKRSRGSRGGRTARMTVEIEKEDLTRAGGHRSFTNRPVPIWVANFVLGEYGTGAVTGVPGHDQRDFQFARKYSLPVTIVVSLKAIR